MQSLIQNKQTLSRNRLLTGSVFLVLWFVVFRDTLADLVHLARTDEGHSHILAIPILVAYFIYSDRVRIFGNGWADEGLQKILSLVVLAGGGIFCLLGFYQGDDLLPIDALFLSMASAVLLLLGLSLLFLPRIDLSEAAFPAILLLLLIPLPIVVREGLVSFLVKGSTIFTEILFQITGTTFYREGTFFLLNGISIEIADECSGIRSSMGLFITLPLASHLFLKKWWSKSALMVMVIPMVLVKNAIRITTLTLLAVHVDEAFLTNSPLHRGGGVVFFALALLLVLPVLILLRKLEGRGSTRRYSEELRRGEER